MERLAILNYDLGDALNQKLRAEFPMLHFHVCRKGDPPLDDALLGRAEVLCGYLNGLGLPPRMPNVRFIHALSAGVDGFIDEVPAHVAVSNSAGLYSVALGEHVLALALALTRRLDTAMCNMLGPREWKNFYVRGSVRDSHVAILGTGDIGTYVANAMRALGARRVTGYKLHPAEAKPPYDALYTGPDGLRAALDGADYVIVCLPGTSFTVNLIDAAAFAAMKQGCIFINIGRGNIVDTAAMMDALQSGRVAAAGLDVTEPEPLPPGHPLWGMENVILTTHYAGWSTGRDCLAQWFMCNLRAYLAGEPLPGAVDRVWKY